MTIEVLSSGEIARTMEVLCTEIGRNGQDPKTKERIAPDYGHKSTDEKLADIQLLEDRALEVLGWFAGPFEKQESVIASDPPAGGECGNLN